MRAVVQRVSQASVTVDGKVVGQISQAGLLVLLGVTHTDTATDAADLARKIWQLRIMREELSASQLDAPILVISQFTLYADTRKGRRPSWSKAAPATISEPRYDEFCQELRVLGADVSTGIFGASMNVALVNDGPMTLVVET
ncbi:MAG: D-aminoacyl-tRNA deacylase [Nocardioidaceae bacterium]